MPFLDRLDRKFHGAGIPHLTVLLVIVQALGLLLSLSPTWSLESVAFIPSLAVRDGEWWRLASLLCVPPCTNLIFAVFGLYLFLLMGETLERQWGVFRYNLFILIAYAATVGAAFLSPDAPATTVFIGTSVFLAFATLYPNFELYLFFILPVRIKWLALFTWISYGLLAVTGTGATRWQILAATANYLLFFWGTILLRIRSGNRRMREQAASAAGTGAARHRCAACGATEKTHPQAEFRYCTKCEPVTCFCGEHIRAHAHLRAEEPGK